MFSFTVPPELRPRYYPYSRLPNRTRIIWPTEEGTMATVIIASTQMKPHDFIIFSCRFTGRPRARVEWRFNDDLIQDVPELESEFTIEEVVEGASILTIPLEFFDFGPGSMNPILGMFNVQCNGVNAAGGLARGTARVHGIS